MGNLVGGADGLIGPGFGTGGFGGFLKEEGEILAERDFTQPLEALQSFGIFLVGGVAGKGVGFWKRGAGAGDTDARAKMGGVGHD